MTKRYGRMIAVCCLAFTLFALCIVIAKQLGGYPCDWDVYRYAVRHFLTGRDPYQIPLGTQFHNPPWTLFLLLPFAILPEPFDMALVTSVAILVYAYVAVKFHATPMTLTLLLTSLPVIQCIIYGQIDWLVVLGFVLPPQIGILFAVIKPQVGIGMVIYWVYSAWKSNGISAVAKLLGPALCVFGCSLLGFGFWPLRWFDTNTVGGVSSLWPHLVPVGLGLLMAALQQRNTKLAIAAAPCLSPHVWSYSYVGILITLVDKPWILAVVSAGLWMLQCIKVLNLHTF